MIVARSTAATIMRAPTVRTNSSQFIQGTVRGKVAILPRRPLFGLNRIQADEREPKLSVPLNYRLGSSWVGPIPVAAWGG